MPYCLEKQQTDKLILKGVPPPIPGRSGVGRQDAEIDHDMEDMRREQAARERRAERRVRHRVRAEAMSRVPVIDYDPARARRQALRHYREQAALSSTIGLTDSEISDRGLRGGLSLERYSSDLAGGSTSGYGERHGSRTRSDVVSTMAAVYDYVPPASPAEDRASSSRRSRHRALAQMLKSSFTSTKRSDPDALYGYLMRMDLAVRDSGSGYVETGDGYSEDGGRGVVGNETDVSEGQENEDAVGSPDSDRYGGEEGPEPEEVEGDGGGEPLLEEEEEEEEEQQEEEQQEEEQQQEEERELPDEDRDIGTISPSAYDDNIYIPQRAVGVGDVGVDGEREGEGEGEVEDNYQDQDWEEEEGGNGEEEEEREW